MTNKKLEKGKTYMNVCVVGLSGYDTPTNCLYGVGKSCFCNRFMKSTEDEYYKDHVSIFSTSDFVGSVLNNDHFLYWGTVDKKFDDNLISFRLIEQTEFIDDASYLPLSKGGQMLPYVKRATVTKLQSPGKIMYISRDQVALQSEFTEIQMDPLSNGKIQVDGFICIYDVSTNLANKPNHSEIQEDVLSSLLLNISKTKRPVVVVATKCDNTTEQLLYRAHQFVHSKKVVTPLVESSAENFVNIDLGIQILYQLADTKSRGYRTKLISYQDGLLQRNELINKIKEEYLSLIKGSASSSTLLMSWVEFKKLNSESQVFKNYVKTCGIEIARRLFEEQAKKVKQHHEDKKLNEFLNKLPDALDELLPSIQSIEANEWKWEICQQAIKNHIFFDKWFLILPENEVWNSPERLFSTYDTRLPFDVLQSERSRACFDRHIKKLRESARKILLKNDFRKLLESTVSIRPGTSWADASLLIDNEDSYKHLDETERKILFETYLRDITLTAKLDFQELLFESARKFSKLSKDIRPSEVEMQNLYSYLKDDPRYKNLENLGNGRDILLFNHIALMQSPNRCLSGPEKCMDRLMQQVVEMTTRRAAYNPYENDIFRDCEDEQINILVLGKDQLGQELKSKIKSESSSYDSIEYIVDGEIYGLNIKVHDSNQTNEELFALISECKPQGYLAIFSTENSLAYIENCLERIREHEKATNMSLIIMLANEGGMNDAEISNLRSCGQSLAYRMNCAFLDYPYTVSLMDDKIHDSQVQDALRRIIDVINKRVQPSHAPPEPVNDNADIRVLLCAMCGDEYPVELILGPMMQHHTCYSNPEMQDTVVLDAILGGAKRKISVTLSSYHRAYSLKSNTYHGFILIYSATRLASLETFRAFASSLPEVPIQVLAVTGSFSLASVIFHEETSSLLLSDCSKLKTKLNDQFSFQKQAGAFMNFFNHTYEKRHETEFALHAIKRRKNDPLPDVPSLPFQDHHDEGQYMSINPKATVPNDSPYVKVAVRHSYLNQVSSDSDASLPVKSNLPESSNLSEDSIDEQQIDHDETGLYTLVSKKKKPIMIQCENDSSDDEEDDDEDMLWLENEAFEPTKVFSEKKHDPPYASVPFLPKGHKLSLPELNEKFPKNVENLNWNESDYASIDQIKPQIISYDPDNISNNSSKSKESIGSQGDNFHSPMIKKTLWHDPSNNWDKITNDGKVVAPIAKPDNDENEDIKDLRKTLEKTLVSTPRSSGKLSRKQNSFDSTHKNRSESNLSAALDQKSSFIKKFILKVTPNPSPANSDTEVEVVRHEHSTPAKKKKHKSFRVRNKHLNGNNVEESPPAIVVQDNDEGRDRSSTLPLESPLPKQSSVKFLSLDHRKHHKTTKTKYSKFYFPESTLIVPSFDPEKTTAQTLDRKKNKSWVKTSKTSKDDLDLPENGKSKKSKKSRSVRFPSGARPKPKVANTAALQDDWVKKQTPKTSSYFGKPLKDISPHDSLCPVFVSSVLKYLESSGMQSEGLYRISGNKNDIEAVQMKFEQNINLNLQELGVSVHAVTGALKNFFKMLPDPLVPYEISSKIHEIMIIMDAAVRLEKLRELVSSIPQPNQEVFKRFMCHLKRVSLFTKFNKMDVRNLQIIIYPTILRPVFESLQNMSQNMNMGLFIQTCIEQSDKIFDDDFSRKVSNDDNETLSTFDSEGESLYTEPSFSECVLNEPSVGKLMKSPITEENDYEIIELPMKSASCNVLSQLVTENVVKENLNSSSNSQTLNSSKNNSNDKFSNGSRVLNRQSIETAID